MITFQLQTVRMNELQYQLVTAWLFITPVKQTPDYVQHLKEVAQDIIDSGYAWNALIAADEGKCFTWNDECVDDNPQEARDVFGDNYAMYCDWCKQVTLRHKSGYETALVPVTIETYFALEVTHA